jgi:hypothetical protein
MNQLLYFVARICDSESFSCGVYLTHAIDVLMASPGNIHIVVLVTSAFGGIGGIETFNRALIGALDQLASRNNWSVQVLSLLDREDLPGSHRYVQSGSVKVRGFSANRVQFALSAIRAGLDADVAIIGHINLASLALFMNSSFKCSIAHGIEVWKSLTWLRRLGVSRIHRILSVSAYTQREMMAHNNLTEDRFCIFPNTLDPLAFLIQEPGAPPRQDQAGTPIAGFRRSMSLTSHPRRRRA